MNKVITNCPGISPFGKICTMLNGHIGLCQNAWLADLPVWCGYCYAVFQERVDHHCLNEQIALSGQPANEQANGN